MHKITNNAFQKLVLILMEIILHFVKAICIPIMKKILNNQLKNIFIF